MVEKEIAKIIKLDEWADINLVKFIRVNIKSYTCKTRTLCKSTKLEKELEG